MTTRSTSLAVIAALALAGAGCGKDEEQGKPIPSANAGELNKQLDAIERRFQVGDGACNDITRDSEPSVARALDQIPAGVDRKVRDALRQSFSHLFDLTATQCDETKGTETTPTETQTTPEPPPPPPPATETQQTETQQTQTQETTPGKTPPGQQKKQKNRNGKSNGNGGGPVAPGRGY